MKVKTIDYGREIIKSAKMFKDFKTMSLKEIRAKYSLNMSDIDILKFRSFNKDLTYKEFTTFSSIVSKEAIPELLDAIEVNPLNITECCRVISKKYKILPKALNLYYYNNCKHSKQLFFIKAKNPKIINVKNKY